MRKLISLLAIIGLITTPLVGLALNYGEMAPGTLLDGYYKLENNGNDDSYRGRNFSDVGTLQYVPGRIGQYSSYTPTSTWNANLGRFYNGDFGISTSTSLTLGGWCMLTSAIGTGQSGRCFSVGEHTGGSGGFRYEIGYYDTAGVKKPFAGKNIYAVVWSLAEIVRTLNVGQWYHWLGTFDGSVVRFYLDAVPVASVVADTRNGTSQFGDATTIHGNHSEVPNIENGGATQVDEFFVDLNTVWTQQNVQNYYAQAKGRRAPGFSF